MKIGFYLALAAVVFGGMKWAHNVIWDSGWNAHAIEVSSQIEIAERDAVAKARTQWENTARIAEAEIIVEERIVERIRFIEKEIPTVVEKIVTLTPECNDLGPAFAGLLNAQIRAGADNENGSANAAAKSDGSLREDVGIP